MSKEWLEIDQKIGDYLTANGVASFANCPEVRRTMIYKGDVNRNAERQEDHYNALNEIGCVDVDCVTEIGAGIGQFARRFVKTAKDANLPVEYTILDLPNVSRIQQLMLMDMPVDFTVEPKEMESGLIVSLFALSEMEYDERKALLEKIGIHNAMFFAFQDIHNEYDNEWWFAELGKALERPFTMSPAKDGHWYMYVEEE